MARVGRVDILIFFCVTLLQGGQTCSEWKVPSLLLVWQNPSSRYFTRRLGSFPSSRAQSRDDANANAEILRTGRAVTEDDWRAHPHKLRVGCGDMK